MALDHALAHAVDSGAGVLRLYEWDRPTVSFGRNEPTKGLYAVDEAADMGIDFVRRPTGGRAVYHAAELTYAVVAPLRSLGGARTAYERINRALAAALGSLGARVTLSKGVGETAAPDAGPCFASPAPGEVVADGGKLVGSAQARIGGALLQHGSILLGGDQSALASLTGAGPDASGSVTLARLIGDTSTDVLAEAVSREMQDELGGRWSPGCWSPAEVAAAERLESERYALDSWTWRR